MFAVTSLTFFLFCQIIWRSPVTGYVATAEVEFDCSPSDFASPPRETDVHRALEPGSLPQSILARVDHLRSYVTVRTATSSSERSAYEIRFVGTTCEEATRFANAIADHVSHLSNKHYDSQPILVKNAETDLKRARELEAELQIELASLISGHRALLEGLIAQAKTAASQDSNRDALESAVLAEFDCGPAEPRLNPEWERLNLEFQEATERINQLGVNHTNHHPLVQTEKLQAEQLSNRLAATPRLLEPQRELPWQASVCVPHMIALPLSESSTFDAVILPDDEIRQDLDKLSRLADAIRRAASARVTAEDNYTTCIAQPRHSHTRVTTTPARIVASIGGTPTLPKLAQILLMSVVFGGLVSVLAGKAVSSKILRDARDVAQQLDLPVVATLDAGAEKPALGFRMLQRSALTTARLCEMALIALVIFVVLVALSDSRLATGFLDAPFQTFSEVFERYRP